MLFQPWSKRSGVSPIGAALIEMRTCQIAARLSLVKINPRRNFCWVTRVEVCAALKRGPQLQSPSLVTTAPTIHTKQITGIRYLYTKMASKSIAGKLTLASKVKLADGNLVPRLGLGVYEMSDQEASRAVTWALEAGYRHFDW